MLKQGETRWIALPLSIMRYSKFLQALAHSFSRGEQTIDVICSRTAETLGKKWRWVRPLARRYLLAFPPTTRPSRHQIKRFFLNDNALQQVWRKHSNELVVVAVPPPPQRMQPIPAAESWDIVPITSIAELAEWVGYEVDELLWFADLKGLGFRPKESKLRHYSYRILTKNSSSSVRVIESPKRRLKDIQIQTLKCLLQKIPPHESVHGFVKKRSVTTFVAPHVSQDTVLRMDVKDFFPSFSAARVQAFFRTLGYPEPVADLLGALCTTATPRDVWGKIASTFSEERSFYTRRHLPQGVPTSPLLANLCFFRTDCRLNGLAKSVGARYTRYADDLAFSGSDQFGRVAERFTIHAAAILLEEGLSVNHRKTRIMRRAVRQQLAGIVVNDRPNVPRPDFDRLKALLTNCARLGPESQNRDAKPDFRQHLQGRVEFVAMVNPFKGKKLQTIFNRIAWPESAMAL